MLEYNKDKVIGYGYVDGALARITAEMDPYANAEPPHRGAPAWFEDMVVRVVWADRNVSEDYYETGDDEHADAWRRIREGENAEGIGQYVRTDDEDVELFVRYMRVFHPLVPVVEQWVTTGYCQGDSVRLIAWSTAAHDGAEPVYVHATSEYKRVAEALDFIGRHARGQYAVVGYEVAEQSDVTVKEDTLTGSLTWSDGDDGPVGGVDYLDEFGPETELLKWAEWAYGITGTWLAEE